MIWCFFSFYSLSVGSEKLTPHTTLPTTYDYDESTAGNFTYQFTLMNLNDEQAAKFSSVLSSSTFTYAIAQAFGSRYATTSASSTTSFESDPLEVDNGNDDDDDRILSPAQLTVILVFIALFIFGIIIAFNNNLYGKLFPKKQPAVSTAHM